MRAPPADLWQPVVHALNDVLLAYAAPQNWREGKPVEPLPSELAHLVAYIAFSEPLAGRAAPVLAALILPHRTETPSLEDDRRDAVAYVAAARAGLIETSEPEKAVRSAFAIPRQTLSRWLERIEPPHLPEPQLGEDRDEWRAGIGELLKVAMEKAGQHYQAFRHVKARRRPVKLGALCASRSEIGPD